MRATAFRRWSAGRRFLAFPPGSHPDGIPEGAPPDGTRNPVLSACGFGQGRDSQS
jgi:hypothetical protein